MGRFKYTDLRPADHWHRISRVEKSPVATSHSDGYWQHTFNYRMVSSNDGYAEEHASVMDKRFEDRKTWREALIAYAPLFLWSCVIFYLSSNGGSLAETSRFIGPFLQFLFSSADEFLIRTVHGVIRKAAHVTEYAILASLASRAFLKSSINWLSGKWALWALILVAIVATIDETNQSFNAQRTGSPRDLLLDISGGVLAILVIWFARRIDKNKSRKSAA